MAIIGAGERFTGSSPACTESELNHHVRTSHAQFMISEPHIITTVQATAKECKIPDERIFVLDNMAYDKYPYQSWERLLHHGQEDWVKFKDPAKGMRNMIATLAFTSGNTGLPKAAMISHHYSVAQIDAIRSHSKPDDVGNKDQFP